ncbi:MULTISPECIES: YwdI family protein [Neobacillus]|uniref:YwdI family protein n=1 Tax=Neobacillus sedimentimangrovi TaxID=2699460 RepID=A0ABS8QG62_9BACI|nr:YwdI family protein [Neobacillus sedimentimangrovi]AIM16466.1 hypothetical protein HW35_09415 [Bacillus sp. X1(2014)]MCD4838092.1 YwdI family protein [Neobacillus sedimentimangrovi]
MNISVQKLLMKMEEELQQARTSQKTESLRERIHSIKILCELILDEKQVGNEFLETVSQPVRQQSMDQAAISQPIFQQQPSISQSKKLDMDDGANGDSLFDF